MSSPCSRSGARTCCGTSSAPGLGTEYQRGRTAELRERAKAVARSELFEYTVKLRVIDQVLRAAKQSNDPADTGEGPVAP